MFGSLYPPSKLQYCVERPGLRIGPLAYIYIEAMQNRERGSTADSVDPDVFLADTGQSPLGNLWHKMQTAESMDPDVFLAMQAAGGLKKGSWLVAFRK